MSQNLSLSLPLSLSLITTQSVSAKTAHSLFSVTKNSEERQVGLGDDQPRWRTEMVVTMNRDISTEQRSMRREEKRREEMLNIKRVFNAVSNYQKRGGGEATHPVGGCGYSCPKTAAFKYRTTDYVTDNAA
ncbi:hypothetical protein HN51_065981 [Arachis hypogaea]